MLDCSARRKEAQDLVKCRWLSCDSQLHCIAWHGVLEGKHTKDERGIIPYEDER
jgi:hypothetical protein